MTESRGGCLCGAVGCRVHGRPRPLVYCHCNQCRRSSGHYVAATARGRASLELVRDDALRWYRSSARAERGFCGDCGSSVFWRRIAGGGIGIMAGTLDTPTRLTARAHVFVASASDYYPIDDGLPTHRDGGNVELKADDAPDTAR